MSETIPGSTEKPKVALLYVIIFKCWWHFSSLQRNVGQSSLQQMVGKAFCGLNSAFLFLESNIATNFLA
jgi:hypothetical protein